MDNAIALPAEGSRWTLDGLPVFVDGVKKKGRGYYVLWASENSGGRIRLKEFQKRAAAA